MKKLDRISALFILVGAINWGLIGLFNFDLIDYVFGQIWIDRLIYILMGLSSVYKIVSWQAAKSR